MSASFKIDDMLLYASCPLKYAFMLEGSKHSLYEVNDRLLVSAALKRTYIKYFQMQGSRRAWTSKEALKCFSAEWIDLKKEFPFLSRRSTRLSDTILQCQEHILKLHTWLPSKVQVAAADFQIERTIRETTISSSIDALLVKQVKEEGSATSAEIIILDHSITPAKEFSMEARLKSLLALSYARRELLGTEVNVECKILNVYTREEKEVSLEQEHRFNYIKILKSLSKCMEEELIYPRPNKDTCSLCVFRAKCKWASSK